MLALAGAAASAGCLAALPGASDAPQRTLALMAAHHERPSMPVPRRLAAAVIATEDEHFDDDVVTNVATGVARAALAALQGGANPGGATIDQQLAKALYGGRGGVTGTLRQVGLGVKLGLRYSHREILAMYLNVNYYGNGLWGVRRAAQGYFRTTPSRLSWAEASMLAGLLQAPTAYDPVHHLALAKLRQRHVLARLVADHTLTAARAAAVGHAGLPLP